MGGVGVISKMIPVHPQRGQTAKDCSDLSEKYGAFSYDEFGTACWKVYGKAVQINPVEHSIRDGFAITNFNFNATGKVTPVETVASLPGSAQGFQYGI